MVGSRGGRVCPYITRCRRRRECRHNRRIDLVPVGVGHSQHRTLCRALRLRHLGRLSLRRAIIPPHVGRKLYNQEHRHRISVYRDQGENHIPDPKPSTLGGGHLDLVCPDGPCRARKSRTRAGKVRAMVWSMGGRRMHKAGRAYCSRTHSWGPGRLQRRGRATGRIPRSRRIWGEGTRWRTEGGQLWRLWIRTRLRGDEGGFPGSQRTVFSMGIMGLCVRRRRIATYQYIYI